MTTRKDALPLATCLMTLLLAVGCTGGSETKASDEGNPSREAPTAQQPVDAVKTLATINPAIPLYQGAEYREDLTRRDEVMIRSRYGAGAKVYTLATDDSFPQVYHYYTTYLAQFRSFAAESRYPSERQNWRTLEVQLNQAMQDPFIPGEALDVRGQQVTLQVAETEAEPKTVIRYIVTARPVAGSTAPMATASATPVTPQPVAR